MKILKLLGRLVAGLVVVLVVAVAVVYFLSNRRMNATHQVDPVEVATTDDSATIAYGGHVAEIRGCTDCHRPDLGGRTFIDGMPMARLTASNLTAGGNGLRSMYGTDGDWVRAIRDGVRPDGSLLLFMPSYEYRAVGPDDLGALISWIKSMPPVDTEPLEQQVGLLGRLLFLTGAFPLVPAEMVDHGDSGFSQPEATISVEYGGYLATTCVGCHGEGFSGGAIPGTPPEWPDATNITPDPETGIGSWTEDDFLSFFENGQRPDGRQVDPQFMPWPIGASMTLDEKRAIWMFLRSLPQRPAGNR